MTLLRNVGACLLGLFVGALVNLAILAVSWQVYPPPPGMDGNDPAQLATYVASLPPQAFLFVLAAHLGQAFVGGWVAARLGSAPPVRLALVVGVLTMIGGLINLLSVPAPVWLWIEVPLYLVVAWAAGRLVERRRATAA